MTERTVPNCSALISVGGAAAVSKNSCLLKHVSALGSNVHVVLKMSQTTYVHMLIEIENDVHNAAQSVFCCWRRAQPCLCENLMKCYITGSFVALTSLDYNIHSCL